jgi:hypothetical protein
MLWRCLVVFFVSLGSLCFATDEDGSAVENFCNTLFKHIGTDISKLMDFFFLYIYIQVLCYIKELW